MREKKYSGFGVIDYIRKIAIIESRLYECPWLESSDSVDVLK